MDKKHYSIRELNVQGIKEEWNRLRCKIVEVLEKEHVVKRKRVVHNCDVILDAAYMYIIENFSYQRLADAMAVKYDVKMSDTAWKKQLGKVAPVLFNALEQYITEYAKRFQPEIPNKFLECEHAHAIDATDVAQVGKEKAVMRVHTQMSLNEHGEVHMTITDNHTSENVTRLPIHKGHLYIADRGYGYAGQLSSLMKAEADFVTRISPGKIKLYEDEKCTKRVEFPAVLSEKTSIELTAFFQYKKAVYPVRVVGEQVPADKQEQAEEKVCKKAKKNSVKEMKPTTILYSKWMIVATSLPSKIPAANILRGYRERWQIELLFKRSKTLLGLKKRDYPL